MVHDHNARLHAVRDVDARKERAAVILHERDVARLQAPRLRIRRVDPAGFAVVDVRELMAHRAVELAVHAVAALAGHEGERMRLGLRVDAFGRHKVRGVPEAVLVAVGGDLRRIKLNEAALGCERIRLRILAEGFVSHKIAVLFGHVEKEVALLPEFFEGGELHADAFAHLLRFAVETLDPAHLVETFGIGRFKTHALRKFAEDPVVGLRLPLRLDRLLHRHETIVRVGADIRDVVVFEDRCGREHDVGVAVLSVSVTTSVSGFFQARSSFIVSG